MEGLCALIEATISHLPDQAKAENLRAMYERCIAGNDKPAPGDSIVRPMTGDNGPRPQ
jgi:hypothetical protein